MRRLSLVAMAGLLALVCAAPAMADIRTDILKDCKDDSVLQGSYTPSQIRDAREHMPPDIEEYTDCPSVLRRAELPDQPAVTPTATAPVTSGGGTTPPPSSGGGGGGGGRPKSQPAPATPTPPAVPQTPQDNQALADASKAGTTEQSIGGKSIVPVGTLTKAHQGNNLPGALVFALILLAVAGVAFSIPPLRRRLPFSRPAS